MAAAPISWRLPSGASRLIPSKAPGIARAKSMIKVETLSQSAQALLPPHECGGFHYESAGFPVLTQTLEPKSLSAPCGTAKQGCGRTVVVPQTAISLVEVFPQRDVCAQDFILGYFRSSLTGLVSWVNPTQDFILGYFRPSLRDLVAS